MAKNIPNKETDNKVANLASLLRRRKRSKEKK